MSERKPMRLWKVLGGDRSNSVADVRFVYPPDGEWTEHLDPESLALCQRGYHYCQGKQVLDWLAEGLLAEVEPCPEHEPLKADSKYVTCSLRVVRTFPLTAGLLSLFACDCAERALERERRAGREPDPPCWEAVRVARRHVAGEATGEELAAAEAAAWAAAGAAAEAAAGAAAEAAAWAAAGAAAWAAAGAAAWAAAWAAAGAAAWAAAGAAAGAAERAWQYQRLLKLAGVA